MFCFRGAEEPNRLIGAHTLSACIFLKVNDGCQCEIGRATDTICRRRSSWPVPQPPELPAHSSCTRMAASFLPLPFLPRPIAYSAERFAQSSSSANFGGRYTYFHRPKGDSKARIPDPLGRFFFGTKGEAGPWSFTNRTNPRVGNLLNRRHVKDGLLPPLAADQRLNNVNRGDLTAGTTKHVAKPAQRNYGRHQRLGPVPFFVTHHSF